MQSVRERLRAALAGSGASPSLDSIPGWFEAADQFMFRWLLEDQANRGVAGDLVEIGAYLGKSAVLIGQYLHAQEKFTVLDLFGSPAGDPSNEAENDAAYAGLTRAAFEKNYLRFHHRLPTVVHGLSSSVRSHVSPGGVRFAHIDGSHLYGVVRDDAMAAREYLAVDGVVAFDDYRTAHAPGVAAAIWETVLSDGLIPIAVTDTKLYGTWGAATEVQERLRKDVERSTRWGVQLHAIRGPVLRIYPTRNSAFRRGLRSKAIRVLRRDRGGHQ